MELHAPDFKANVKDALADETLQRALKRVPDGFIAKRAKAFDRVDEFDQLRDTAVAIKNHTLDHIADYLEQFERNVTASGGQVHWARDGGAARAEIAAILKAEGARLVTKGKSMVTEEIELNAFLEAEGIEVAETDLGEYIIQLRGEKPSHIIAPAVHVTKDQVEADFRAAHQHLDADRNLEEATSLVAEARAVLRQRYLDADAGITGANFLIAESGSTVIVTNEGNGDLTQSLPRTHIVVASIEKILPTLQDAGILLRLLARSATGQDMSSYTTFSTGPKRGKDADGPQTFHVILLDNGRSDMLGTEFQDMLRCIRCGACMNHCPVYHSIGGHAYGATYVGPMGAVLSPALAGVEQAAALANASSFCGRCEEVCPVKIPLPKMMRHWREREFEQHLTPARQRWGLGLWSWLAQRPKLYRLASGLGAGVLSLTGGRKGRASRLPLASGWTDVRDLPTPSGGTFMSRYRKGQRR